MRYSAKRKQDISVSKAPIEAVIPLLEPVRIYTAIELAAMPLSKMNEAIAAQEAYYLIEHTTKMGGASQSCAPFNARGRSINTGNREIKNTIQDQKRVCRTTNYSTVGKTWIRQAEWRC